MMSLKQGLVYTLERAVIVCEGAVVETNVKGKTWMARRCCKIPGAKGRPGCWENRFRPRDSITRSGKKGKSWALDLQQPVQVRETGTRTPRTSNHRLRELLPGWLRIGDVLQDRFRVCVVS